MNKRGIDTATAAGTFLLGLAFFIGASGFSQVARVFPQFFSVVLMCLGVVLWIQTWASTIVRRIYAKQSSDKLKDPPHFKARYIMPPKEVWMLIGVMFLYFFLLWATGFLIPTMALVFSTSWILGYRNFYKNAVFSIVLSTSIYLIAIYVFQIRF